MNKSILHKDVQDFISQNLKTNITKLVLKGSPFDNINIQEIAEQIVAKNKCQNKLPTWFQTKFIYYPNKLNIEQTSSEITANYKSKLIKGKTIIDITGGFGVDCLAFSSDFKEVTHCEINTSLSQITTHNYKQLKIKNINTIVGNGIDYIKEHNKKYDCIYVDPSRRDDLKKRVFLLEDCLPNLPENLDLLFKYTNTILVKTAPLLDINAAKNELKFIKEIHVIAVNNDVKEVLYLLNKNHQGTIYFKTINITKEKNMIFYFATSNENAIFNLPQTYLYEPNAAIMKSGAFSVISSHFNINKLHQHSHLYTSSTLIEFPGRRFEIIKVLPYNIKKIKTLKIKKANITTRNFPETVATIRKKTKIKDGGNKYLFFTTNLNDEKIILICTKIKAF